MTPKKQTLLITLSSTVSPDLVCGWKSSIGNSVRGDIVGLHRRFPVTVYVHVETDGLFSANVDGNWKVLDKTTVQEAVCLAVREWAKHQTFDHLPKFVRALPGVAEDANEKKRADIKAKISEAQHRLKCWNSEHGRLIAKIDQENAYIEQLEKQLETV